MGVLTESMDQNAEAAWCVTETASHFDAANTINEERTKCLVLAVCGVGGLQEDLGDVS